MKNVLMFQDRDAFHAWLEENHASSDGVWLMFGKKHGPVTLSAQEALKEALCFGWIDGQMQSIDDTSYQKYFSKRRPHSKWSEKNKKLAVQLEKEGKMTAAGKAKIEEAKQNGQWNQQHVVEINNEQIMMVADILKPYEKAYTNFMAMSCSVKKTYTRAYLDAKTEKGRNNRIKWMVERLNQNLKPM